MEGNLIKSVQLRLTKCGAKLFRNNTGTGWVGKKERIPGGIIIRDPRPLKAGLFKGSSDLIGWTPVRITPEMVGKTVAVFTAIEVKTKNTRLTKPQAQFIRRLLLDGGFGSKVMSAEEAEEYIKTEIQTFK